MISFLYQWFSLRKSRHVLLLTMFCLDLIPRFKRCLTVVLVVAAAPLDLISVSLVINDFSPCDTFRQSYLSAFFAFNIPFIVSHGRVYRFSFIHLLGLTATLLLSLFAMTKQGDRNQNIFHRNNTCTSIKEVRNDLPLNLWFTSFQEYNWIVLWVDWLS